MGLFSSKKKTVVSTVVSRVIQDNALPDAMKTALMQAIFNDEPLAEAVTEGLVSSVAVKAERMYEYARTKYTHGLPGGQIKSAIEGKEEVTAILTQVEGAPVQLVYSRYAPPNYLHIAWFKLTREHGYNQETNQLAALSAIKGTPVWLDNLTVVVPAVADFEPRALEQWGTPATAGYTPRRKHSGLIGSLRAATPVVEDPLVAVPHVRVDYLWEGPPNVYIDNVFTSTPVIYAGSFTVAVDDLIEEAMYFQAKYTVGGVTKYQLYEDGSGVFPVLDDLFVQQTAVNGTFFPFAYFRYNKASEIADKTTAAYKTSKKLVKYLGMDYDQVAEAIDENPDIADVEQAMLVMAVPATTTNALELRYLYAFFDNLFYADGNQFASPIHAGIAAFQQLTGDASEITNSSILIQDSRFKMALSNSGIFKKRVMGNIGATGTHAMAMEEIIVEQEYLTSGEFNEVAIQQIPIKVHVYRYQLSPQAYDEIKVVNLKMLYHVFEQYTVTADEDDDILLIPLDHSITSTYSMPDREKLYSRSLHYVFNSRQIITIKWYQQMWFQFVMIVVSVIITVATFGAATGPLAALMAATTAAAAQAALIALLIQVIQGLLIGLAFKLFVKAVGPQLAMLLAVIALVVSGYMAFEAGSIAGAPWAADLLQLGNSLARGAQDVLGDMMKDLLAEYRSLELFKDEATKELEAANKLLEHDNWLSPMVIFGESPNDFYNRTVHSGNIGIQSISAISSYVDIALTLPKLDDTIER